MRNLVTIIDAHFCCKLTWSQLWLCHLTTAVNLTTVLEENRYAMIFQQLLTTVEGANVLYLVHFVAELIVDSVFHSALHIS